MTIGTATPRDQLDTLLAFVRRALHYWWIVVVVTAVGGALSLLLAAKAKPRYMSEAKLLYNERISSSLLQGRDVIQQTKNLGNRYRELLLARQQLAKVIAEFDLFADVLAAEGLDAAIEELQELVTFRIRDAGVFHIQFVSQDPHLSQAVTQMLTTLLIDEDARLRRESASATKDFLLEEKAKVNQELSTRLRALAAFLAEHPEFAEESAQGMQAATGAGVRAAAQQSRAAALEPLPALDEAHMDPRLLALERQRRRIRDRLAAPDDTGRKSAETQEQREAREAARAAKRELDEAQRRLDRLREQFLPAHPDVVRAKVRVEEAERRLTRAEAAVPPAPPRAPPIDREALRKELQNVERQIATIKVKLREESGGGKATAEADDKPEEPENWVVALETEFAHLSQAVDETRRRVIRLDQSLSAAEITASQQMAEEGAVLTVVDPANLPSRPQGKGRLILFAAGFMASMMLGTVLVLCLALVDDRIYSAGDLEHLGIAPVAVVIPKPARRGKGGSHRG